MPNLTQEQFEKLTPYKDNLNAAYKNGYVRMAGSDFEKVAAIYAEVFGTPLRKSQMSCNTCRLTALKKLGELYDKFPKPKEDKEKKETRRGRPNKLKEEKVEE